MKDQATALRELKANYDKIVTKPKTDSIQLFLEKEKEKTPIFSTALVYPDNIEGDYPDLCAWLPKISEGDKNFCLLDQAGLLKKQLLSCDSKESPPFLIIQKQIAMLDLPTKTEPEKIDFLRNISSKLDNCKKVWITIKSSDLPFYDYLIKAVNSLVIMFPETKDSLLKVYETVKNIHSNSNLNSQIQLLEFSSKVATAAPSISIRVKDVAKQFLGIDLEVMGMVLSNCDYVPQKSMRDIKNPIVLSNGGFVYSLAKNVAY